MTRGVRIGPRAEPASWLSPSVANRSRVGSGCSRRPGPAASYSSVIGGLLTWLTAVRYRPATLVRCGKPPSFDAPPSPLPILGLTALLPIVAEQVSTTVDRIAKHIDLWWLDTPSSTMCLLLTVLLTRAVWTGFGVRLRPDGIVDRRLLGSLFVPWEAIATELPAATSLQAKVVLAFRNLVLVRGSGVGRRDYAITAISIDNRFLNRTIQEYASHPQYRSAIGTVEELHRLHAAAV